MFVVDIKGIDTLARLMQETGLTSIEVQEGNTRLKLERQTTAAVPVAAAPPVMQPAVTETAQAPAAVPSAPAPAGKTVLSPTVGVFYAAPSPEADAFVQVGDAVKKGDVLCIIEAMKLMNEIQAEEDGVIAEICAGNGQVVEYDQPLFRLV